MESSFKLTAIDIDYNLPLIKMNLESQDENFQLKNIESILKYLRNAESEDRDILLQKFERSGVMRILLNILHSLNDRQFPCILELLILAKDCRSFFISETAMLTIKALINVSFCFAKSTAEMAPMLEQCIVTMCAILKNGLVFAENLMETIHRQILAFVKMLYVCQNCTKVRLSATKLFNMILANISVREDIELLDRCLEALKFTEGVIVGKEDNVSVIDGLVTLCGTCAFGSSYCTSEKNRNNVMSTDIQDRKESLGKAIYRSLVNTILPKAMGTLLRQMQHPVELDLDNESGAEFLSNFLVTLRAIYNLEYCNHEDLSTQLTANGYLKYFLRLSVNCSTYQRRNICIVLLQVLRSLEQMVAPPSEESGFLEFSNQLYELESLPMNPNDWFVPERTNINSQTALLALIYHHCRGTQEVEVISYEYFALKLTVIQQQPQRSSGALRVLWFLLAVVYTRQEMPRTDPHYRLAIKRLTSALSESNVSDCYTHHIDLMRFSLDCAEFPIDLQRTVLRLWLLRCNGDVKPLLKLNSDKVLRHYFFIVLHSHHQDSGLTSLVKIIRELVNENNAVDVTKAMWDVLPELLSNYHPDKNECLKLLLELTIASHTSFVPISTIQDTADAIVKIVLRVPTDTKLRALLITQARVLLDESLTRNATQVLETYVSTHGFLQSLWHNTNKMEDLDLTVTCLKLSVLIVQRQQGSHIQLEQPVEVEAEDLAELLFQGRNITEVRYSGLLLLSEFLTETDEEPAIRLAKINPNSEEAGGVFDLLRALCCVSRKVDFEQKGLVYQCLKKLLDYYHRRVQSFMHPLCTNLSICSFIDCIFEMDEVTSDFLYFISCWLRYRASYCAAEGRWNPTSICKTPYEQTVDRIKKYTEKQDKSRSDDPYCKLLSALSKIP